MNKEERIELFSREISYIEDKKLKEFAKIVLENADEYFFTVPASSSGKYHPAFAKGEGGLVRHTKAVAFFTNEFIRSEMEFGTVNRHQGDLLIIAAIAHDIKKQGDGNSAGHTMMKEHPALAAEYIKRLHSEYDCLTDEDADYICKTVRSHMGPWCDIKPSTRAELTLYYADFVASRSEISGITFIDNNDNSEVVPTEAPIPSTPMTVEEYVFTFGQTKGMTIKEAYEANAGYIKWMANKEGFGNVEVQNLVKEFLKNK